MITSLTIYNKLCESGYKCKSDLPRSFEIDGYCSLDKIDDNSITWAKNKDKFNSSDLLEYKNVLIVTSELPEGDFDNIDFIVCDNPKAAYFYVVEEFFCQRKDAVISSHAVVDTENVGKNVSIGCFSYICKDVIIEDNVTIGNHVVIECPAHIGEGTVISSGTVIGSNGYGYYEDNDRKQHQVPHTGGVYIGKNVDIGANVCIDRGTIDDTYIGDYVKIDNLCHIAHNVHIEEHAMVVALSLLAGSVQIGAKAYVAPGVMIMNQKTVGKNALVGMGSVVVNDIPDNKVVVGVPAKIIRDND